MPKTIREEPVVSQENFEPFKPKQSTLPGSEKDAAAAHTSPPPADVKPKKARKARKGSSYFAIPMSSKEANESQTYGSLKQLKKGLLDGADGQYLLVCLRGSAEVKTVQQRQLKAV